MPELVPAVPGTLAEALAALQGQLPRVAKTADAQYGKYADLTIVSEAILPLMSSLGLSFSAKPTLSGEARFVLLYTLRHVSGEEDSGEYPLPTSGSPQQIGSAITYARRYTLCAVTGLAPGGDDDDGQAGEKAHQDAQKTPGPQPVPRTGTNAELRASGQMDRKQKAAHDKLEADTLRGQGHAERSHPRGPDPDDPWAQDAPVDHQRAAALREDLDQELPEDKPHTATLDQQTQIAIDLAGKGITDRADKLMFCWHVTGRKIGSSRELSYNEAAAVLKAAGELEVVNA